MSKGWMLVIIKLSCLIGRSDLKHSLFVYKKQLYIAQLFMALLLIVCCSISFAASDQSDCLKVRNTYVHAAMRALLAPTKKGYMAMASMQWLELSPI